MKEPIDVYRKNLAIMSKINEIASDNERHQEAKAERDNRIDS